MMQWNKLFRPAFVSASALLLIAGVSALVYQNMMDIVLRKKPVPMREPLMKLPEFLGDYVLFETHPRLPAEVEESLGTREYTTRVYRNTRVDPQTEGSAIYLHLAYYTGTPDLLPHVPDYCMAGSGLEQIRIYEHNLNPSYSSLTPLKKESLEIESPPESLSMRVLGFQHPQMPERKRWVGYFFVSNGNFAHQRSMIRLMASDPFDEYAYWCKVEVMPGTIRETRRAGRPVEIFIPGVLEQQIAEQTMEGFMSELLPQLMALLPNWEHVKDGKWPIMRD